MLNNKDKKTLLILTIISLSISAIACVPFTLGKLTQFELILKYIIFPVAIAILTIVNYSIKFRNYRPAYKFPVLASYAPVFSYIIALAVNTLVLLARTNQVYSLNAWIGLVVVLSLVIVGGAVLMHVFFKKLVLFTKNEIMVIDSLFVAVLAVDAIAFGIVASKLVGLDAPFTNPSWALLVAPILLAGAWLAFHILHILKMYKSDAEYKLEDKAELIARFKKAYCDFYGIAYEEIIEGLFDFSAQKLGIEEIEFVDDEQVEEACEEPCEECEKEKEVVVVKDEEDAKRIAELEAKLAEIKESHSEKVEDLQEDLEDAGQEVEAAKAEAEAAKAEAEALKAAAAAKIAEAEAEAARKAELAAEKAKLVAEAKKAIKPSYNNLVNYASALEDDSVTVVANEAETQHKFYYNKKLFLVLADTNVDYRITFLASKESAIDLIIENPKNVSKATSPKGPNWYKLINKGTFEGDQLKSIIKNALEQQKVLIQEAEEEKARIKAEKAAAKKAAKK